MVTKMQNKIESFGKLFEENLFYSNGDPVKVVIADSSIGRVPEAAACADKFRKEAGRQTAHLYSKEKEETLFSIKSHQT